MAPELIVESLKLIIVSAFGASDFVAKFVRRLSVPFSNGFNKIAVFHFVIFVVSVAHIAIVAVCGDEFLIGG
jgi:hypothetical protein